MAEEVKLQPGWLIKDVRKAAQRLNQWSQWEERRPVAAVQPLQKAAPRPAPTRKPGRESN